MIDIVVGQVSIWRGAAKSTTTSWQVLARGATREAALIEAEKALRDDLTALQARLHAERERTRGDRRGRG